MTLRERSGKRRGSAAFADTRNCSRALASGSLGNVEPRSAASSTIRSQRLGVRTTRRSDGNFLDARYRAVTPLAAIMKSSIMSLARFFLSASKSLSSSPSKTGRASIVSRSSAPCRCRSAFSFWATRSWSRRFSSRPLTVPIAVWHRPVALEPAGHAVVSEFGTIAHRRSIKVRTLKRSIPGENHFNDDGQPV